MSINKVILVGNIGRDPEQPRVLGPNNTRRVLNISLATSETYTDSKSGERKTDTEWHRVELWDNLADIAHRFLKKGSLVYIEGKIRTEKWTDQQGIERTGIKIRANNLTLLGSRSGQSNNTGEGSGNMNAENNQSTANAPESTNNLEDDLPF
ncbi:MAG: single-stranded DNA-binding protein [Bacteroidia bacterium]|jgi:single-strand DNA-binding protein|nr:single-stranded DNA-binding protein [Bacteroidia bacterium]